MNDRIRPAESGDEASAQAFLRTSASPTAALVMTTNAALPSDWPASDGGAEDNVAHVLGWTLEVRRKALVLLNPLGEGVVKTALPALSAGWLQHVRSDGSSTVFLVPADIGGDDPRRTVAAASAAGTGRSGTVRSAIADDYGKAEPVGRNAPCPCGSGKKYKHCCG